jgi:hypothetical protein
MTIDTNDLKQVWVFNGAQNHFPSAVFTERHLAEEWIQKNQLEGTLIANFSSATQEHYHFEMEEDSPTKER